MTRLPADRRSFKKRIIQTAIILLVIVIVVGVRLVEEIGQEPSLADRFVVVKVIDGDTVELAGGDRLRLLAVDTPEEGELFHDEATDFLRSLVLGQSVTIEFASRRRDRYGRLLGFVFEDTLFVNKAILDNGLGYLYLFEDDDLNRPEIERMLQAQRAALTTGVGIWSLERVPEDYYINIDGSLRFHRPGCRSVSRVKPGEYRRFSTREEALMLGLSPCRNCRP